MISDVHCKNDISHLVQACDYESGKHVMFHAIPSLFPTKFPSKKCRGTKDEKSTFMIDTAMMKSN